jgi:hypothetical protein
MAVTVNRNLKGFFLKKNFNNYSPSGYPLMAVAVDYNLKNINKKIIKLERSPPYGCHGGPQSRRYKLN